MKNRLKAEPSGIFINESLEGETIENRVRRITLTKEPIEESAPIIYTARKDGTAPQYDIRTDKWEVAIDAMDKVAQQHLTNRTLRVVGKKEGTEQQGGETTSLQATE